MVQLAERIGDRILSAMLPKVRAGAIICNRVYCYTLGQRVYQKCCCSYADGHRSCSRCSFGPHCTT